MKVHSQSAIQFSGYPLSTADKKSSPAQELKLTVVKSEQTDQTTSIQKNKITNDPKNWDLDWFGSYE